MRCKGVKQALGLVGYITLVAGFIYKSSLFFGKGNQFVGPLLFLTLFVVSALICGLIMFYEPYQLFVKDKRKEALLQVVATTMWLVGFLLVVIVGMIVWG